MRLAQENGFSVALCQFVEDPITRKFRVRFKAINMALSIVDAVVNAITLGTSQSLLLDNCAIVLKKNANREIGEHMTSVHQDSCPISELDS